MAKTFYMIDGLEFGDVLRLDKSDPESITIC